MTILPNISSSESVKTAKSDGTEKWYNSSGQLHRVDGPAAIYLNGHVEWYLHGKRHRDDGPAVEGINGEEFWYQNGRMHRLGGPAMIRGNGIVTWRINGSEMSPQVYRKAVLNAATELCDVTAKELTTLPFSQLESFVYAFNGWTLP
jgi:hypothetical protein